MDKNLLSKLKTYRLSVDEYERMKKSLGHEPEEMEWAVYSALWSEHCSYKSSKVWLRKLFTKHPRVVQGPGENAGVIDLGQGERVAFKMESHNHPSFIEPYQGAATGVGGILRDIFTMGARPMASMDYLCFGLPDHELTPRLLDGVVRGIGGYGNCVGVPTVSGQTNFHESYSGNNLVNAFNLGLFRPGEEIFYGKAAGVGNLIVYAGAATGRDGIHGAAMASESFSGNDESKKPNVQIGDPFFEKLLIEACIEVMRLGLVVGIQDMGAAGLTSSTFEMAARAGSGLQIDLSRVPLREPDIQPHEIMLSESQERMVLIVKPSDYEAVKKVFERWDLQCAVIGEITDTQKVELLWQGKILASLDHRPLVDNAPVYERPFERPAAPTTVPFSKRAQEIKNFNQEFLEFLGHPAVASRSWIFHQYDQRVGAKTVAGCGDGTALLRLPDSGRVLAMNVGCRPVVMQWHPSLGAQDALILPTLQMAARGAEALACTDCLNFGNPERPKVMGEFVSALEGLDSACRALEVPIISGNVSLYNETAGVGIVGTPSIGVVGLRESLQGPLPWVTQAGETVFLLSTASASVFLGEYANIMLREDRQGDVRVDLSQVRKLQKVLLATQSLVSASQVVGRGGLALSCLKLSGSGVEPGQKHPGVGVSLNEGDFSCAEIFGERFYSVLAVVNEKYLNEFVQRVDELSGSDLSLKKIGHTVVGKIQIGRQVDVSLKEALHAYQTGWESLVEKMA